MEEFDFHNRTYRVVRSPDTQLWILLEQDDKSATGWSLRTTFDRMVYRQDIVAYATNWLRREQGEFNG